VEGNVLDDSGISETASLGWNVERKMFANFKLLSWIWSL